MALPLAITATMDCPPYTVVPDTVPVVSFFELQKKGGGVVREGRREGQEARLPRSQCTTQTAARSCDSSRCCYGATAVL